MICYWELSLSGQSVTAFFALLLAVGAVFLLVGNSMLHSGKKQLLGSAALTAAALLMFQGIIDVSKILSGSLHGTDLFGSFTGNLPYAAVIGILVGIFLLEGVMAKAFFYRRKHFLTEGAVKESLDTMPDGVCFYGEDGQPLLVNRQMQHISGELFDSEMLNICSFHEHLLEGKVKNGAEILRREPTVIVRTSDGTVWDFHSRSLPMKPSGVYEMIAYDITEQVQLNRELEQRNERLNRVNQRLRRFSREMVALTAEKELLNAKIDVHDNVGRSLLAWRTYLTQKPENRNRRELLFLWRYVVSVMKKETLPSGDWHMLEKTAELLGISIELVGTLPENLKIRAAIVTGIRECLTNTANHAGGDRLTVSVEEDDRGVTAVFTNTGRPPAAPIRETGGLLNLRRVVEQAEGKMTVESSPRFLLRLTFQKGEQTEWPVQEC